MGGDLKLDNSYCTCRRVAWRISSYQRCGGRVETRESVEEVGVGSTMLSAAIGED